MDLGFAAQHEADGDWGDEDAPEPNAEEKKGRDAGVGSVTKGDSQRKRDAVTAEVQPPATQPALPPGSIPPPGFGGGAGPPTKIHSDQRTRYFVIKSNNHKNLVLSVENNVWATQRHNEDKLNEALYNAPHVILIFSVNCSGCFQGYAKMLGAVGASRKSVFPGYGRHFDVRWLRLDELDFAEVAHISNPWNDHKSIKISRDGQELPFSVGSQICQMVDQASYRSDPSAYVSDVNEEETGGFANRPPMQIPLQVSPPLRPDSASAEGQSSPRPPVPAFAPLPPPLEPPLPCGLPHAGPSIPGPLPAGLAPSVVLPQGGPPPSGPPPGAVPGGPPLGASLGAPPPGGPGVPGGLNGPGGPCGPCGPGGPGGPVGPGGPGPCFPPPVGLPGVPPNPWGQPWGYPPGVPGVPPWGYGAAPMRWTGDGGSSSYYSDYSDSEGAAPATDGPPGGEGAAPAAASKAKRKSKRKREKAAAAPAEAGRKREDGKAKKSSKKSAQQSQGKEGKEHRKRRKDVKESKEPKDTSKRDKAKKSDRKDETKKRKSKDKSGKEPKEKGEAKRARTADHPRHSRDRRRDHKSKHSATGVAGQAPFQHDPRSRNPGNPGPHHAPMHPPGPGPLRPPFEPPRNWAPGAFPPPMPGGVPGGMPPMHPGLPGWPGHMPMHGGPLPPDFRHPFPAQR